MMLLLIDLGGTHTFINATFLARLSVPADNTPAVTVRVANNHTLHCDRIVRQLKWESQGHQFATDMRVLHLGVYDGVLGMD